MTVLGGRWTGQIAGTNVGSFVLDLEVGDDGELGGVATLDDFNQGRSVFDAQGRAQANEIVLELTPRSRPSAVPDGTVIVEASIQENGSLSGEWRSDVGTHGTLLAFHERAAVGGPATKSRPPIAIAYQKRREAIPCAVDAEALRRIFRDLSAGSDEAARLHTARQAELGALTGTAQPQTYAHHAQVRATYSVTVIARGTTGEQRVSLDPALLEEENLPKPL